MAIVSIRERIMAQIKRNFENIVVGEPVDDPWTIKWTVYRAPLTDVTRGKGAALSVLEGQEDKKQLLEQYEPSLRVVLEFSAPVPKGEDWEPASYANFLLAELQRRIYETDTVIEDETSVQLALSTVETGSNIDVDAYTSRRIEGALFVTVLYRHYVKDPRKYLRQG